jgi:hypothetical protein
MAAMRTRLVTLLLLGLGCGPAEQPLPEKPFILTDVASIGFMTQFMSGTFVGTSILDSMSITNKGLTDLSITDVTQSGDSAFAFKLKDQMDGQPASSVLPIKVIGKQSTFIQFTFTPTEVKRYTGKITIKSNADNLPSLDVPLFGCGVKHGPDGGMTELPAGGCLPQ